jgi:hypothetical protein
VPAIAALHETGRGEDVLHVDIAVRR